MKTKEEYLRERGLLLNESEMPEEEISGFRERKRLAEKAYERERNKTKYDKFKEEYVRVNCSVSRKARAGERKSDYEILKEIAGGQKLAGVLSELAFSKIRGKSTLLANPALREVLEGLEKLLAEISDYRNVRENEARNIGFILGKVRTKGYASSDESNRLLEIMNKLSNMDFTFYLEDMVKEFHKRIRRPVREAFAGLAEESPRQLELLFSKHPELIEKAEEAIKKAKQKHHDNQDS